MRALCVLVPSLLVPLIAVALREDRPSCARTATGPLAVRRVSGETRAVPGVGVAAALSPDPAPAPAPAPTAPSGGRDAPTAARRAEDVLDDLDAGGEVRPGDEALLAAALQDGAAEPPLRAGALRALLRLRGRALLPALPDLFARPDAGPLRPLLAGCVARAAGPEDAPLLRALLQAGLAARSAEPLLLAAQSVVSAARRAPEDQPTRLTRGDERQVAAHLRSLIAPDQPGARRRAALESLAELGGEEGRAALLEVARGVSDPEDRLDAALLLRALDPDAAAPLLTALQRELSDPLLQERAGR